MTQEKMSDRMVTVVITLVVAGVLGVVGTALTRGALIGALGGVQETEPPLDERVKALQDRIEGAISVPTGAVLAFDLSTGCPGGWTEFTDGAGRTIIGQGSGMVDEDRLPLAERKYREHGGKEDVKLEIGQMPSHSHKLQDADDTRQDDYGFGGSEQNVHYAQGRETSQIATTSQGGGEAHKNMPPYIVLYFCKKD